MRHSRHMAGPLTHGLAAFAAIYKRSKMSESVTLSPHFRRATNIAKAAGKTAKPKLAQSEAAESPPRCRSNRRGNVPCISIPTPLCFPDNPGGLSYDRCTKDAASPVIQSLFIFFGLRPLAVGGLVGKEDSFPCERGECRIALYGATSHSHT